MVWPNKFIFKGVDEGEYADAGTTENLRQLRGRVQGTAEKGLGAAGERGVAPTKPSRVASVIRPESSGERAADSRRSSSQGDGEVGWYREREPLGPAHVLARQDGRGDHRDRHRGGAIHPGAGPGGAFQQRGLLPLGP